MYEYIDNYNDLTAAAKEWNSSTELGFDLECENNMHHFGAYITLFQISNGKKNWIIDALKIKDLKPVLDTLQNPDILKIFHDIGFDLRMISHQYKVRPKNIFDTHLAAQLLGSDELGLSSLLGTYFGIRKEQKFQMADWTKRPLSEEMKRYASMDAHFLIALKSSLLKDLQKLGRAQWAIQESKNIDNKLLEYCESTFLDIHGAKQLTDEQRGVLRELFRVRKQLARKVDKPVHFVIRSKRLIELSLLPPVGVKGWSKINSVHPIVKRYAKRLDEAVRYGKSHKVPLPEKDRKRMEPQQRRLHLKLRDARDNLALKLKIPKNLIIGKDELKVIALTGKWESLRKWQLELLKDFI